MDINTHRHLDSRLEIVDTGRRRRFSKAAKQRIVAESLLEPGLCASTARRYGISRSQLYEWRGRANSTIPTGLMLLRVLSCQSSWRKRWHPGQVKPSGPGRIEVVAANGRRLIVEGSVDVEALVRIIRGLETLR